MELNDLEITTIKGEETTFGALSDGKIALVVNVASRCGLTPQYAALEELQKTYGDQGFTVLGFPSNQFLQELSKEEAISEYCSTTWGVTFPMTEKVKLNGRNAHPIYKVLKETPDQKGNSGRITWNFEKFLVNPDGRIKRFSPQTVPDDPAIVGTIQEWIAERKES